MLKEGWRLPLTCPASASATFSLTTPASITGSSLLVTLSFLKSQSLCWLFSDWNVEFYLTPNITTWIQKVIPGESWKAKRFTRGKNNQESRKRYKIIPSSPWVRKILWNRTHPENTDGKDYKLERMEIKNLCPSIDTTKRVQTAHHQLSRCVHFSI